ncbi:MAG: hypothetical protein JWQ35_2732 [Bacteriovoracaceae bacterium]|nr:hypothetical protein [Bacteriovoracaceae bacterium]
MFTKFRYTLASFILISSISCRAFCEQPFHVAYYVSASSKPMMLKPQTVEDLIIAAAPSRLRSFFKDILNVSEAHGMVRVEIKKGAISQDDFNFIEASLRKIQGVQRIYVDGASILIGDDERDWSQLLEFAAETDHSGTAWFVLSDKRGNFRTNLAQQKLKHLGKFISIVGPVENHLLKIGIQHFKSLKPDDLSMRMWAIRNSYVSCLNALAAISE